MSGGLLSFICFSVNNWEKRMARKQQFMRYLSLRRDVQNVIYVEPPLNLWFIILKLPSLMRDADRRRRVKRALSFRGENLSGKLSVFTPLTLIPFGYRWRWIYNINTRITAMTAKLQMKRLSFKRTVVWLYHPFDSLYTRIFGPAAVTVFDWAEDWAQYFIEYPPAERKKITAAEEYMVKSASIVTTVSKPLLERALLLNRRSYQVLDGVSTELFTNIPAAPGDMKQAKSPVIGYVGTITDRFDTGLACAIAREFAHGSLVLVGQLHKNRVDVSPLTEFKNVYFTGEKAYAELPGYLARFDICILPYRTGSFSSPPTKLFDYLASGKPVVSVSFPEADRFDGLVLFADTNEEFIRCIKQALESDTAGRKNSRLAMAAENSWQARAGEIMNLLESE